MKFWAVLGSQGCREKKLPTAISMQLFGVVFFNFFVGKKNLNKKNQKYFSIHAEKLHSIKAYTYFKKIVRR